MLSKSQYLAAGLTCHSAGSFESSEQYSSNASKWMKKKQSGYNSIYAAIEMLKHEYLAILLQKSRNLISWDCTTCTFTILYFFSLSTYSVLYFFIWKVQSYYYCIDIYDLHGLLTTVHRVEDSQLSSPGLLN